MDLVELEYPYRYAWEESRLVEELQQVESRRRELIAQLEGKYLREHPVWGHLQNLRPRLKTAELRKQDKKAKPVYIVGRAAKSQYVVRKVTARRIFISWPGETRVVMHKLDGTSVGWGTGRGTIDIQRTFGKKSL